MTTHWTRSGRLLWIAAALTMASTLSGCGTSEKEGSKPEETADPAKTAVVKVETKAVTNADSKPVLVDGSSTVFRISKIAQEASSKVDKSVRVIVNNSGTGGGFTKYLQKEADIVDASRVAKPKEEEDAKAKGLEWSRYVVGYDGITVVVNPKNDFVKELSFAQLKAIWGPDTKIKTWKDLNPAWPDREIKRFGPDDKSGTFEYFTEATVGKAGSQTKDYQPSSDDNFIVRGVVGSVDGMGYFGYAYFKASEEQLRAIPLKKADDGPVVMPSVDTIKDKSYPISRPLFIYVGKTAFRRPAVATFVKFYLDKVEEFATEAQFVAPTPDDIAANKKTLEAAGTP